MQGWRRKPEEIKEEIRFTFSASNGSSVRLSTRVCGDENHTETQRLLKGVSQTQGDGLQPINSPVNWWGLC